MRHIRKRDQRLIVRWRQSPIIDAAESLASHSIEVKPPHGTDPVFREAPQQSQPIKYLLPVGLDNFAPQPRGRSWCLFKDEGLDSLLGQSQTKHRPTPAGTHDDDVRFHQVQLQTPIIRNSSLVIRNSATNLIHVLLVVPRMTLDE